MNIPNNGITYYFASGHADALRPMDNNRRFMTFTAKPTAYSKTIPNFRRTSAELAGQVQIAAGTALTLAAELDLAGRIIQAMLSHLTVAQKQHIGIDLVSRGVISDDLTRNHERQLALAQVKKCAINNWSVK